MAQPEIPFWLAAENWRNTYFDIFKSLFELQIPFLIVRNEDVRKDRDKFLEAICCFLGLNANGLDHYDADDLHSVGGNPTFNKAENSEHLVEALKSDFEIELSLQARREIANVPGIFSLANDMLGYGMINQFA